MVKKKPKPPKYLNEYQPKPIVGFFHGIDVASQNDYYTDVVHVLTEKPDLNPEIPEERFTWSPFLVGIMRVHHMEPDAITDLQIRMFNKFPPHLVHIDSSREEWLTNALIRKYGESKIIPVKFLNSGTSNVKFKLKQVGYSYLKSGYQWPDITQLEKVQPRFAKLIRILKKEMLHEQVKWTENERVTFNHPIGKHNDLVHGWELSLEAVMEFQQKNLGYEKRKIENQYFKQQYDEIYQDYPTEESASEEIYDRQLGSAFSLK
jgi:disulfide oxidoreductase YuzD